ncbi:GGDEF domain-containing protein [Acidisoma sp. C75]
MNLDPITLIVTHGLLIVIVSLSYFMAWVQTRDEDALLWMAGGAFSAGLGVVVRFGLPAPASLILANGLVEGGMCGLWMACRRLSGRPAMPWILGLPLVAWALLSGVPWFFEDIGRRIVLANIVMGSVFILAVRELWRLEDSPKVLRFYIMGLLGLQAAVYWGWAAFNLAVPPVSGPLQMIRGIMLVNIASLITTLLMAVGFIVLVRERAMGHYRSAAIRDALTGVGNRRAFEAALDSAGSSIGRRPHRGLALLMIDVDHFKSYNDQYGHVQGDWCLRKLAIALDQASREDRAKLFRYGGEEFVVMASGLDLAGATRLANRLLASVRSLDLAHERAASQFVTVSIGVAIEETPATPGDIGRALVRAADNALYQAKVFGRNQAVIIAGAQQAQA